MRILVTRPLEQARTLAEKITASGNIPVLLPTIEIMGVAEAAQKKIRTQLKALEQYHLAIFISANAVQKTAELMDREWPAQVRTAVIGSGTAEALRQHHWPVDICPTKQFNSEGLLTLSELQCVSDKRILVLRGTKVRELIVTTLRQRGALVTELAVYQQVKPQIDPQHLPHWQDLDVIICTSNMGLNNLYEAVDPASRSLLLNIQLVVSSQRLAAIAKNLGFVKSPLIADNAGPAAVMQVILNLQERHNGKN